MGLKWTKEEETLLLSIRKKHPNSSWKLIATKYNAKVDDDRHRTHWSLTWKHRGLTAGTEIRPRGRVNKIRSASAPPKMRNGHLALGPSSSSDLTTSSFLNGCKDTIINKKEIDFSRIPKIKRAHHKKRLFQPRRSRMEIPTANPHYAIPPPSHFHSSQVSSDLHCRPHYQNATSNLSHHDIPARPVQFAENSPQQVPYTDLPSSPFQFTKWPAQLATYETSSDLQQTYFKGSQNNLALQDQPLTYTSHEENVEHYANPYEESMFQKRTTRHDPDLSLDKPLTSIGPHPFYNLPHIAPGAFGYGDYVSRTYYNPLLALQKRDENASMSYYEN